MSSYKALAHAMQSGVAMWETIDPKETEPKHLRVGINSAMSDMGGLATLLMKKGVFTLVEYEVAIKDAMAREVASYEHKLSEHFGRKITLG